MRVAVCVLLLTTAVAAQTPAEKTSKTSTTSTTSAAAPADPLDRATPRGAVLGFLAAARKGDDQVAAAYLNTPLRGDAAGTLARQLFVVLDTRLPAKLTQLSDRPEGSAADPLNQNLDPIGTIARADGDLPVVLERVRREPYGWIWLFSRQTLDAIPDVHDEVAKVSIEALLPPFFVNTRIGGVRLFEWIALFGCVPLLYLCIAIVGRILRPVAPRLLPAPVRLLLLAAAMQWTLSKVGFPIFARQAWSVIAVILTTTSGVWLLILLNGWIEPRLARRLERGHTSGAPSLARVARRGVDVVVIVGGMLLTLQRFGVDPAPALAGLGVGGIAVALAAQKTLENVVAGVSLIFDQALHVGDAVKINSIVGTVDYIGLRSTRIRTLDRTIVSVPNGQIAAMTLEVTSARDKYWFHPVLRLASDTTAAQVRAIVQDLEHLLLEHDLVDRDSIRVRFYGVGAWSFDIEALAYVVASGPDHFFDVQDVLLLGVMSIVREAGVALASPDLLTAGRRHP